MQHENFLLLSDVLKLEEVELEERYTWSLCVMNLHLVLGIAPLFLDRSSCFFVNLNLKVLSLRLRLCLRSSSDVRMQEHLLVEDRRSRIERRKQALRLHETHLC